MYMLYKLLAVLALATYAMAASCKLKKLNYPFQYTLGTSTARDMTCGKGDQEVSATIYTREYESLAKSILQKGVFKSVSGDDKDVYDCGSAGIKSVNVKSIQGCLNKGKMHADMGIEYVCNQQARIRSVSVDFVGQVSGNC